MFFGKPWDDWISEYQQSHLTMGNKICHFFGIPMIFVSLLILPFALYSTDILVWSIGLFLAGWVLQFIGHAIEQKPPEFLSDWRFLFVGLRWWFQKFIIQPFKAGRH